MNYETYNIPNSAMFKKKLKLILLLHFSDMAKNAVCFITFFFYQDSKTKFNKTITTILNTKNP